MLLVYYEVVGLSDPTRHEFTNVPQLVQRGNSNIVNGHLKGAMTIMRCGPQVITPTTLFLERVSSQDFSSPFILTFARLSDSTM
jgi:hypothetical protein